MSFFGSLMSDLDDDPIFGSHIQSMRHMNNMMNSLFNDPFGMMGHPSHNAIAHANHRNQNHQDDLQVLPFGFPPLPSFNMGNIFSNFDNMASSGNCHSFVSNSVMTFGSDGRPQVYEETTSTTTVPGGIKETKTTVCDSRTGKKKMAIEHHIGDRAHILEREQNIHSGEQEEHQEFINLDEEEAESFNKEWESRVRHYGNYHHGNSHYGIHGHRNRFDHRQLALPDPSGRWTSPRRSLRLSSSKPYNSIYNLRYNRKY
ncbi:myeloid leukemia factor isoform X1 [Apis laboriosa]|uniref:myeloid leukemia factor isoform X1 n=1 Tax=Apis laboriosa TaxID=183418 RepID=UPI001CC4CF21|nr:myeloid leukemia factor isoform X1 [Apis laboriosa]